jgi:RNA polymerase sigma factor (sigma-70 family)
MDRTDFHRLYASHARDVYRFALLLTGSEDAADDITAEVFLRAWAGADAIRQSTARAYLIAIARNLARDGRRRKWRELAMERDFESGAASGEDRVEFERTMEALRTLPDDLREPLTMSAVAGMSYEEVSEALGLTMPTVKIRIFRARQKLAAQVGRGANKEVRL